MPKCDIFAMFQPRETREEAEIDLLPYPSAFSKRVQIQAISETDLVEVLVVLAQM
jgi:hypothetical protein